ncbi:LapA family protein [Siculibacillus lacustris]|uniref:LapA family protein n=1 Tax=Siculibacillus lacustris TaxID=1549641 RepID=A0A4Q9VYK3_9HYPH|nr:LapA family protein [Siculibacillus lacustris]TBW41214.1 LapA family protein [Siculibacillus lacustris]
MTRLLSWLVAVPLGVVVVALAVANRRPVTLSLDPFRPDSPAFSVAVPLFALIFAALLLGVILGGVTVWWRQGVHRRTARARGREIDRLQANAERLTADLAARTEAGGGALPVLPGPGRRAA